MVSQVVEMPIEWTRKCDSKYCPQQVKIIRNASVAIVVDSEVDIIQVESKVMDELNEKQIQVCGERIPEDADVPNTHYDSSTRQAD